MPPVSLCLKTAVTDIPPSLSDVLASAASRPGMARALAPTIKAGIETLVASGDLESLRDIFPALKAQRHNPEVWPAIAAGFEAGLAVRPGSSYLLFPAFETLRHARGVTA